MVKNLKKQLRKVQIKLKKLFLIIIGREKTFSYLYVQKTQLHSKKKQTLYKKN